MAAPEDTPDQRTADTLATFFEARELLNNLDDSAFGDSQQDRLLAAREQLDDIVLNLSRRDLESGIKQQPAPTDDDDNTHTEDSDTVPETVEFTQPLVELIDMVSDEDETVSEWVRRAARERLAMHDKQYWNSVTVPVEVDLPPETARWAHLWKQYYEATNDDYDPADVETELLDYVGLDFEWHLADEDPDDVGE